ncbi:Protein NRT1/ PTR FAMILY 2.11 [Linum perenne]
MEESRNEEEEDESTVNYRGIKAMPYIIGNETFEKLGTVGSASNLIVYLTTIFNMTSVSATTLINVFNGTCNLATLVGAFLCDTYFGRYNCLAFASVSSFLGMLILMLTAAVPTLHPRQCPTGETNCSRANGGQFIFLLSSFAFLIIGAGGIRPCNLTFGADQFDPSTESGRKGTNSFFNWYYFTYTFAVMVSVTGIVYVQSDVSWAIGLGIPAFLMFLSCAVFFWGTSIYVLVKPQGSPLTSVLQVLVAASRKKKLQLPQQHSLFNYLPPKSLNSNLSHTTQFRCLDKAAITTDQDEYKTDGSPKQPWRLCSVQQVEQVKCIARILPIWSTSILFHIALMQQQTYGVFQALQADRRLGSGGFRVPAATYIIFTMIALTFWIPIYDRIIVPYIEKITGKEGGITLLQRMGVGLVLGIMCMVTSGLVEEYRKHIVETKPGIGIAPKGGDISAMSSMWLVPQLVLTGLAEGFNYIAQVEFYYKQFPESMRSIAQASFFAGSALSSYLSGFLVSLVHHITSGGDKSGDWLPDDLNKGKLDYFYYMLAGLGILNFGYFLMCAQWYVYKEDLKSTVDELIEVPGKEPKKNMHIVV